MTVATNVRIRAISDQTWRALTQLVEQNIQQGIFPAATLAVMWRGEWLLNAAWGWVDPKIYNSAVTPDTLFDLASVSKLFTMTAFLSAVSERHVDLDAPLQSVIPEFGTKGDYVICDGGQDPHSHEVLPPEAGMEGIRIHPADVTLRHLLTHTSGLAVWRAIFAAVGPPPVPPDQTDPIDQKTRWSRAVELLCQPSFVGRPGDAVRYSDLSLMLLGEAASRLHGTPGDLARAVQFRVLDRLGLTSVTYNPVRNGIDRMLIAPTEYDAAWRKRRIWGEVHDENACGVGGIAGHAGLFANVHDVAAFGEAWRTGAQVFGIAPDIVSASVKEQAVTNGVRRGLGWALKSHQDSIAGDLMSPNTYGHTGFTGISLFIDPLRELVIASLTNRVYPGRDRSGSHMFSRAMHDLIAAEVS